MLLTDKHTKAGKNITSLAEIKVKENLLKLLNHNVYENYFPLILLVLEKSKPNKDFKQYLQLTFDFQSFQKT